MLPTSTKEMIRFTPPGCEGMKTPPVYLIRTASTMQRAAFRRDLLANGIVYPSNNELRRALRDGVRELVPEPARSDMLKVIDEWQELERQKKPLGEELLLAAEAIEQEMLEVWRPYSKMRGQRSYYLDVAPIIACQHFLAGAENCDVPIRHVGGLLSQETLDSLPPQHVTDIGARALLSLVPPEELKKNFASPSPSPDSPTTSAAKKTRPTARSGGKSAATSTRATRNSA